MLVQLLTQHPEAVLTIARNTPTWVWGLLTALLALGASQAVARQASLVRVTLVPVAMLGFSLWGIMSAFGNAGGLALVLLAWLAAALMVGALVALGKPAAGTRYDAAARRFALPGSLVPLVLIVGIFLTKYAVGVELVLQPKLAADTAFAASIAPLYGVFNGIFAGRALRLLRLAFRPAPSALAATAA